jgi:hypothetical protein
MKLTPKLLSFVVCLLAHPLLAADPLATGFASPPPSARPWVYLFPLDGNLSREGITADLEAMQRVGIGGVLYMETDQGAPTGPAAFGGTQWRELFKHLCAESQRLGLEVNMNNDAGWCGSGGPWITPELSMQRIVWTETNVSGPQRFEGVLPRPEATKDYYRDIVLYAYPTPATKAPLLRLPGKSAAEVEEVALRATYPVLPADAVVARSQIVTLSAQLGPDGRLRWDVPAGNWTLLRMGCTTTGKENHPAPLSGRGLECDKLSKQAVEVHFDALMGKLIAENRGLVGEKKTLVATHVDSWEVRSQNWTPDFRAEFQRLRGYDPMPLLPVMSGRILDSVEVSERFLWDVRQTVNDLIRDNYFGHFRTLAHRHGLRFTAETYGRPPFDDLTMAGQTDEPMAEFWSYSLSEFNREHYSCLEMASAGHVYGRPIVGAEAFTSSREEKWLAHPATIKELGDWAFSEGINRFVFHRYAQQPWTNPDRPPGMSMGPWGLHYERTQTWWEQSKAWHEYLTRCQALLQQGLFVADFCYLTPERSPQQLKAPLAEASRPARKFDFCPPEVVLTRMSVRDGRLVLPDGMSYRMLVLPRVAAMTPRLLRQVRDLVQAGATVLGAPPLKSPSLENYPQCDKEVQALVRELWGANPSPTGSPGRAVGRGRILWPDDLRREPEPAYDAPSPLQRAKWIWRQEGRPGVTAPPGTRHFRRTFEVDAGRITSARLAITADNTFECWVNGQPVSRGQRYQTAYRADVAAQLKPGTNLIAVTAVNTTDTANPAGLVAALEIKYAEGRTQEFHTDASWQVSLSATEGWSPARELGPMGMPPWGNVQESAPPVNETIDLALVSRALAQAGVMPDFETSESLRYIHKRIGNTEVYFVANPESREVDAVCTFRVSGRRPQLWDPETGARRDLPEFSEKEGRITVPLRFGPTQSWFVVFEPDAGPAQRIAGAKNFPTLAKRMALEGPWNVNFDPKWGSFASAQGKRPGEFVFEKLTDWSAHPEPGIKYYSGTATYACKFQISELSSRSFLDLGRVEVMAEVTLNGKKLGILWKPPYRVEVTGVLQRSENTLEIKVVNLWVNRMIGDERLPEDSERNPNGTLKAWPAWLAEGKPSPAGRFTFTSWRLWKKDDPLAPSGLLGPVTLQVVAP